uniref:hypothetical protein n=1 Tax=Micromonospora sp. NBC_00855 TaxID=2975978 RepID=UPI0022593426|nr:hypothetical protein OHB51_35630 [Micromonospora sp. NBC_00855]
MAEDNSALQVREFLRARSKASGDQFENFYRSRNLDMDENFWTAAQRREFKVESDALTAEWNAKQQELLARLRTEFPDGEWTRV